MDPDNTDAWEAYQLAGSDPNGISITGVAKVCEIMGVEDIQECVFKVLRLVQVLEKDRAAKPPSSKGGPP